MAEVAEAVASQVWVAEDRKTGAKLPPATTNAADARASGAGATGCGIKPDCAHRVATRYGYPGSAKNDFRGSLVPLVDAIDSANAAKVTGMLLEMDQAEVLHLIESADALKAKVQEALAVLAAAE